MTSNPDTTSATSSRGKEAADDDVWVDEKAQEASGVSYYGRSFTTCAVSFLLRWAD